MARRVLVTRATEDARVLSHALGLAGFEAVEVPLLQRLWQVEEVAAVARTLDHVDVVLITSPAAADVLGAAAPAGWLYARVAAVGNSTGRRLQELGIDVHIVPTIPTSTHLMQALGDPAGLTIFYPRADLASEDTTEILRARGAKVIDVVAYTNVAPRGHSRRLRETLPVDATTLLSGSAARRVADAVAPDERTQLGRVVVIGPTTGRAAREAGLEVHGMASPYSVSGMVEALRRLFR